MADIVVRSAWGARPRQRAVASGPVQRRGLVVHHAVTPQWVGDLAAQRVQNIHLGMGWADVGYTFLIDVRGTIFQGRALNLVGAHTSGHNDTRHAVCIIGDFTRTQIPQPAIDAIADLHRHGAGQGWWPSDVSSITRHRDHSRTACPGDVGASQIGAIRSAAQGDDDMAWLNRWPSWARATARRFATSSTDPDRKVADMSTAEFLVFMDRLLSRR